MARTDILNKALSIAEDAREGGARRGRAFADALLRTMSGAGDYQATLTLPAYPRDAQRRDLERIGKSMYGALGNHAETQTPQQQG